jgi:methionyl-tRNA formyltransferase
MMRKPRIALFALNGIGSMVLKDLCDAGYNIVGLWTRREPNPHPYYRVEDVDVLARTRMIPVFFEHEPFEEDDHFDLLLSCTYHKKILEEHRRHADVSINIHQSLLPRHRGKNPFKAVIEAKDKESGVTAHHIDDEWDHGKTIEQWPVNIEHLNEGEVRARLGFNTVYMAAFIIQNLHKIKATTYNHIIQSERIEKWV